MSHRKRREHWFPSTEDVCLEDEADPRLFFGEPNLLRKRNWKALQLCKQVERAVALTLASECAGDALLGASVASVEPAPDAARLLVTVVLSRDAGQQIAEARAALLRATASFRAEVARTIHRKRVPELVFDVLLGEELPRD